MNQYRFTLINDQLTQPDAKQLLAELIEKKINYYKIQNMKSLVSNECCDQQSLANITTLSDAQLQIQNLLKDPAISSDKLKINTTISIELA